MRRRHKRRQRDPRTEHRRKVACFVLEGYPELLAESLRLWH